MPVALAEKSKLKFRTGNSANMNMPESHTQPSQHSCTRRTHTGRLLQEPRNKSIAHTHRSGPSMHDQAVSTSEYHKTPKRSKLLVESRKFCRQICSTHRHPPTRRLVSTIETPPSIQAKVSSHPCCRQQSVYGGLTAASARSTNTAQNDESPNCETRNNLS